MTRRRAVLALVLLILTITLAAILYQPGPRPPVSPLALSPLDGPPLDPEPATHFVYLPFVARNWDGNLLRNAGFEAGIYGGQCRWLNYPDGVWSSTCFDEQDVPLYWTGGWIHEEPCYNDYVTGLPEMRLAERWADSRRVHSGDYAAQAFTFYRCGFWWWQQEVVLPPGEYQGSAYIQTWDDGTWAHICLADYCGPWFTSPDEYLKITTPVMELSGAVVFRVEYKVGVPIKNSDGYLDSVELRKK